MRDDRFVEPRSVVAVLPLVLAVVLRVAWRAMQREHPVPAQQLADDGSSMTAGAVQAQDRRRSVLGEVLLQRARHLLRAVLVDHGRACSVRQVRVRGNQCDAVAEESEDV